MASPRRPAAPRSADGRSGSCRRREAKAAVPRLACTAALLLALPVYAGVSCRGSGTATSSLDAGCGDALEDDVAGVELLQREVRQIAPRLQVVALAEDVPASRGALPSLGPFNFTRFNLSTTDPLPTGVRLNAVGDLKAFLCNLATNVATFAGCIAAFVILRRRYPLIFSGNVLKGLAPSSPDNQSPFSWLTASLKASREDVINTAGMDQAMLLEFANLAMKICVYVGGPLFCITGPMNCIFGGHHAGEDHMSYFSFGNIEYGSGLYWVHAFVVWAVVLGIVHLIYEAQHNFIKIRWTWMRRMAPLRANTVLVSRIPDTHQSDEKLREFFETIFPGDRIKSTYVVKDTSALRSMLSQLDEARHNLVEAQALKADGKPTVMRTSVLGGQCDAVEHWGRLIAELEPQVKLLRKRINDASGEVGEKGYNCSHGFVTFHGRADAELALRLDNIAEDSEDWQIEVPPIPTDILWADLMQDPTAEWGRMVIGYLCVGGLYFAYMPLVISITNIAKVIHMGPLQPIWSSLAPTLGLTVMVSMLPTFIIWIFKLFFTLKAEAWAQHQLQAWYFWFNIVFVVLATAVGQNTEQFMRDLVQHPFGIFGTLADTVPFATHFYWNYMVLQWTTHAMNMMRYIPLTKFKMLNALYEEEEAASRAEPEDQDYYGLGSRSAQWATNMVIGIVYGTLAPPMFILTFANFAICRVLYGYLIPFAETKKPDLGGVFWVRSLKHLFYGLIIYAILMTGVLGHRANSLGPMIIVSPTIGYAWWSLHRFYTAFNWEKLPFFEFMSDEGKAQDAEAVKRSIVGEYIQEELLERD